MPVDGKLRILVLDNYDSFTYNIVQYLGELNAEVTTLRNDVATWQELGAMGFEAIVVSPGPGTPIDAGVTLDVIKHLGSNTPILGVCLGHQAIAEAFGGDVVRAERLMHGRASPILHDGRGVFKGIPSPFTAARYHSLIVDASHLPPTLEATAHTDLGELMGLRHRTLPIEGVQFHPESFLSEHGHTLLGNFLEQVRQRLRLQAA